MDATCSADSPLIDGGGVLFPLAPVVKSVPGAAKRGDGVSECEDAVTGSVGNEALVAGIVFSPLDAPGDAEVAAGEVVGGGGGLGMPSRCAQLLGSHW